MLTLSSGEDLFLEYPITPSNMELPFSEISQEVQDFSKMQGSLSIKSTSVPSIYSLFDEFKLYFQKNIGNFSLTEQSLNDISTFGMEACSNIISLPDRLQCEILLEYFEVNVMQAYYLLNMEELRGYVECAYTRPESLPEENLMILHLALSLGSLFADLTLGEVSLSAKTKAHFQTGLYLLQKHSYKALTQSVEGFFLVSFYYLANSKLQLSWINLKSAIVQARNICLHKTGSIDAQMDENSLAHKRKLWRSLYVFDRLISTFIGNQLIIQDYTWGDSDSVNIDNFQSKYLWQMTKLAKISGRISESVYCDSLMKVVVARNLGRVLKNWATGLDPSLQVSNIVNSSRYPRNEKDNNTYCLLLLHLNHLHALILLGKPFFLQHLYCNVEIDIFEQEFYLKLTKMCIKAAYSMIQILTVFMDLERGIFELYFTANYCFIASLILAMSSLHRKMTDFSDEYAPLEIIQCIVSAKKILSTYSKFNPTAKVYTRHLSILIDDLCGLYNLNLKSVTPLDFISPGEYVNFQKYDLSDVETFQKSLLSDEYALDTCNFDFYNENELFGIFMQDLGVRDLLTGGINFMN